jgi:long-chain fatty acid transport protein
MRVRALVLVLVTILALGSSPALLLATNGYFQPGYGTKSKGMAGAGVAFSLGPMSPATNPAAIATGPGGWELGVALFNPNRDYEVTGQPSGFPGTFGLMPGKVESGSTLFPVPHVGYARNKGKIAFGLAMYGNGGMNTNYDHQVFGSKPTGVNLSQLFVAPTVAFKINDKNALGVSAVLGYQMFKAEGLQAFSMFSSDPANLTNNDTDSAVGMGVRVGYQGKWSKFLSVGAAYQSKVLMGEFDKYKGLYAEQGDFDIPSNYTVGIGVHPTERVDLAVDVQRVNYSEIKSVGNPMLPNLMQAPLGADGGAGFGWEDMTVVKLGLQVRAGTGWTVRGGYSYGQQPIPESEVIFNILAPGVIEQHLAFGVSRQVGNGSFDFSLIRALSKDVTGGNPLEVPGLQKITLRMDQWDVGVGYSYRF